MYKNDYKKEVEYRRKKFNVNQFNKYNGGHPNKETFIRGSALGLPGHTRNFYEENDNLLSNWDTDYKLSHSDAEEFHVF